MKRLILLASLIFTSSIFAEDTDFFGVDITRNNNIIINNTSKSEYYTSANIKLGYMSNIRRHYISYSRAINNNSIKYESFLYNYDYFLPKYDLITPFIGANIGMGILHYNNQQQETIDYGMKIGLLHDLTYSSHIDIGFKYSNANNVYIGDVKYKENKSAYFGVTIGFEDLLY